MKIPIGGRFVAAGAGHRSWSSIHRSWLGGHSGRARINALKFLFPNDAESAAEAARRQKWHKALSGDLGFTTLRTIGNSDSVATGLSPESDASTALTSALLS